MSDNWWQNTWHDFCVWLDGLNLSMLGATGSGILIGGVGTIFLGMDKETAGWVALIVGAIGGGIALGAKAHVDRARAEAARVEFAEHLRRKEEAAQQGPRGQQAEGRAPAPEQPKPGEKGPAESSGRLWVPGR